MEFKIGDIVKINLSGAALSTHIINEWNGVTTKIIDRHDYNQSYHVRHPVTGQSKWFLAKRFTLIGHMSPATPVDPILEKIRHLQYRQHFYRSNAGNLPNWDAKNSSPF